MAYIAKGVQIWFKQRLCGVNLCVLLKSFSLKRAFSLRELLIESLSFDFVFF